MDKYICTNRFDHFAWTAPFNHIHWIVPCVELAVAFFGIYSVFASFIPYLIENGGVRAPIVMAVKLLYVALWPPFFHSLAVKLFTQLTIQGGTSLLAELALLMTPWATFSYRYRAKLRELNKA